VVEKYEPEKVFSAVFFDAEQGYYYLKRFKIEPTEKLIRFIGEHPDSQLVTLSSNASPRIKITFGGKRKKWVQEIVDVADFIAVKSYKARGKRLTTSPVESITPIEAIKKEDPIEFKPEVEPEAEENHEIQKSLFDPP
jgi:topoisomerase-4 subunit A